VLVGENDPEALARALEALIRDPARRRALGEAGLARVRGDFALEANLERLAVKFGLGRDARRLLRTA
jgi:glycosyltransferase involved in cell wall biosynthesis